MFSFTTLFFPYPRYPWIYTIFLCMKPSAITYLQNMVVLSPASYYYGHIRHIALLSILVPCWIPNQFQDLGVHLQKFPKPETKKFRRKTLSRCVHVAQTKRQSLTWVSVELLLFLRTTITFTYPTLIPWNIALWSCAFCCKHIATCTLNKQTNKWKTLYQHQTHPYFFPRERKQTVCDRC